MSFTRELQAWTQAQVDRLRVAVPKHGKIAEDINKLLRDRLTRDVVVKSGAPIQQEFVRNYPRGPIIPPPTLDEAMESGMLRLPLTSSQGAQLIPLASQQSQSVLLVDQLLDYYTSDGIFSYSSYLSNRPSNAIPRNADIGVKELALSLRSFELTGKLSLLVKSQIQGFFGVNYSLIIQWLQGVRLNPETVSNSFVLFTFDIGKYLLIHFSSGTVKVRMVLPPPEFSTYAASLADWVSTNGWVPGSAEYQRYEAYILSVCDFSGSWYDIDTYAVEGEALYYGWKPTWKGTKASIVTHVRGTGPIVSRLYTYTFAAVGSFDFGAPISEGNEPITCSLAEVSNNDWVPRFNSDIIYTPDETAIQYSEFWYPYGCGDIYIATSDFTSVPLYCWYSYDNRLIAVTFSRSLTDDITNPYGNNPIAWRNATGWYSEGGSHYSEMGWTTGGSSSTYAITAGAPQEIDSSYADPAKATGGYGAELKGYISTSYTMYTVQWYGDGLFDCENWTGGFSSPVQCLDADDTISLNYPPDPPWTTYSPSETDNYCIFIDKAPVIAMLQACEIYYHNRSGTINTKQCLVITSGNAESATILKAEYQATTGYDLDEYGTGIGANKEIISGDKRLFKYFNSSWRGGSGGGCDTQVPEGNLPSYNDSVTEYKVTIESSYVDRWGKVDYGEIDSVGSAPVVEGNGLELLFNNPVCGDGPYDFPGWFLTIGGTEGSKFYQKTPGNLSFQDFSSNCDVDWVDGEFRVFAGWE